MDNIQQAILNKARQDKFKLIIDTPPALKDKENASIRDNKLMNRDKMSFSLIAVSVPPHAIPEVEVPWMGQTMHVTSLTRPKYPPVKVSFTIDNNFDNYYYIWKWMEIMNKPLISGMDEHFGQFVTNTQANMVAIREKPMDIIRKGVVAKPVYYKEITAINKYTDYQTMFTLIGLREYNEEIVKFNYHGAFPVSLGEINYDYRETGELSCSFDFAYSQKDMSLIDPV
jgi:hypothetical protein